VKISHIITEKAIIMILFNIFPNKLSIIDKINAVHKLNKTVNMVLMLNTELNIKALKTISK